MLTVKTKERPINLYHDPQTIILEQLTLLLEFETTLVIQSSSSLYDQISAQLKLKAFRVGL